MVKNIVQNNPLFFAFLFPALADGLLTLAGQDPSYWAGSKIVNEASPAYYVLVFSPWAFIIGGLFWFIFWYWLFKRLKEPINIFLMFLFISGHSWGSSSWLVKILRENGVHTLAWYILIAYFALVALAATYCLQIYLKKDESWDF